MDSNEERDQQRDRQFAAAVRSIAETDLELWRDEHDIHALARASHAAAQHAEMLAASGPDIDESAKAHLLAVLQAQSGPLDWRVWSRTSPSFAPTRWLRWSKRRWKSRQEHRRNAGRSINGWSVVGGWSGQDGQADRRAQRPPTA